MPARSLAFVNARLVDPETSFDGPGALIVRDGVIADVIKDAKLDSPSADLEVIDCAGAMLAPGLVDLRVKTGEPGAETRETLKSASRAAAAGGVTSIVVQPDTLPEIGRATSRASTSTPPAPPQRASAANGSPRSG